MRVFGMEKGCSPDRVEYPQIFLSNRVDNPLHFGYIYCLGGHFHTGKYVL